MTSLGDDERLRLLHQVTSHITEARERRGDPMRAAVMSARALSGAEALVATIGNSGTDLDAHGMLGHFFLEPSRSGKQ